MNIHEQVKAKTKVIDNCLKKNSIRLPKTITQHNYITKMANMIIDVDKGKELNYFQLSKHPKHQKVYNKSFANKLGRLDNGVRGQVEEIDTMFFIV